MPNNTRNNSKNKSYSTKNENDRFGEIIDYICAQHNINQNELIEKINNYMGFNFLADNTLLSKYKKFLKIPKDYYNFFTMNITLILIILKEYPSSNLMY